MANEIDVCNLALSHLGDSATVAAINPPEGSVQAMHCARFYPIARDALLEMHDWNFCTRRESPALLVDVIAPWLYCYAKPNLCQKIISVISPEAEDDYSSPAGVDDEVPTVYVPQPYAVETLADGTEVICTNQEDAVLRYTAKVTDPTKFSSLFVMALSWLLASMLAGPIIKGDVGQKEARRCQQEAMGLVVSAKVNDANQKKSSTTHSVPWLSGR